MKRSNAKTKKVWQVAQLLNNDESPTWLEDSLSLAKESGAFAVVADLVSRTEGHDRVLRSSLHRPSI